jgi:hypothetical protein
VCVSDIQEDLKLEDFCSINTSGTKILVGSGPYLTNLMARYTDVIYVNQKEGQSLAHYYANADVIVCPNGFQGHPKIVAEAACCGTPVAARSHHITDDLIIKHVTGEISPDLSQSIHQCLNFERSTIEQIGHLLFTKQNNLISHL